MENLNAEQIIKALECHIKRRCYDCPLGKDDIENFSKPCSEIIAEKSLALITSQEQRIKQLTEENERLSKLVEDYDKSYCYFLNKYEKIAKDNLKLHIALKQQKGEQQDG